MSRRCGPNEPTVNVKLFRTMPLTDECVDRIIESLAQVNVNLESLRVSLQMLTEIKMDHELRLRSLERWNHNQAPLVAAATFLLGAVCSAAVQKWLQG